MNRIRAASFPLLSPLPCRLLAFLVCALLASTGRAEAQSGMKPTAAPMEVVRREDQPDVYNLTRDDRAMNAAVARARATLGTFNKYLDKVGHGSASAMIKGMFTAGDRTEHIWVGNVAWDGTRYRGRLIGEPVWVKRLHDGNPVALTPEQVSDWTIVADGILLGGYTTLEIRRRLSPGDRAAFDANLPYRVVSDTVLLRLPGS
ncbi:MAG TPA: DUF2314 domain-containing protein [Longimicrobiaceae bacterium]|jgi:uncharacterized protein YegJ (DUF2314 family)